MPIPSVITDLSATAASNSPAGSETPIYGNDYLQAHGAFIRQLYDSLTATISAGVTAAQLASTSTAAPGASLVGFLPSGTGAVATTTQARLRLEVWSADFGHLPSASAAANDTALLAAMAAVYAAGGGTVRVAAGTYQHVTVPYNWIAARSVNIVGAGQNATYFQKSGATSTPVLDLSVDIGVLDIYSTIADLTIVGNAKGHHGLRATRLASITTRNLGIQACDVGFESVGCLVARHERSEWQSNNIGFRCRKNTSGGTIYCNLVAFDRCSIRGNSTFGIDIGDASNVHFGDSKIDLNGTAANTATGGAMIRSTIADETGFAQLIFKNTYLEANLGRSFQTENVSGSADLTLINVVILAPESNRSANIGTLHNVTLINCQAPSAGDTVVIGACSSSFIEGGTINTITDSSISRTYIGVTNSAGLVKFGSSSCGSATLVTGTKAVAFTALKAADMVFVMSQQDGGGVGFLRVFSKTAGVGFTVNSSSATDTSTFAWFVVEPV